jgi:ferrous iron transport protein B
VTVALLGNPNTGKSTLFTALAGIPTRIANYPGVTVERKIGRLTHQGTAIDLVDLPGTYSLAARGPDEQVVVDVLAGRIADAPAPECVVAVVDATNLERNLYLTSQVLEAGRPVVVALTLVDEALARGIEIDTATLARRLGCPIVPVVAPRGSRMRSLPRPAARPPRLPSSAVIWRRSIPHVPPRPARRSPAMRGSTRCSREWCGTASRARGAPAP